jgi:hypothetical protein
VGSDRARVSYDPKRHWRGVVSQQGRVTLEADWNEAAAIDAEDERAQLVDVIGPSGTPDDGYRVTVDAGSGDLTLQAGTMYVGGERVVLDADLDYEDQPDWLDRASGEPAWVDAAVPDGKADEAVWLYLREQEVGAVEDPALLDVALGGPDTSQRLRILQRVVRSSTGESTCADAFAELEKGWAEQGLGFDAKTMRLESVSTLQVSFEQDPTQGTLCDPIGQGGYLGAENQLIRVQVASVSGKGTPTLVWGFDNASFLYRLTNADADNAGGTTTLKLASAPVDAYHQPAKDQAVEILQAAAELTTKDFIAASTGIVTTCASAYDPDQQTLVVSTALDAETQQSPLLFLRVWQDTIVASGAGPFALGSTGVSVTIDARNGVYHVGDYWLFAVRPGTPTEVSPVYPQRILDAPQPPDGPRLWACPLAVVDWADGTPTVTDCRNHFDDLVTLTGRGQGDCCCVDVSVDDVAGGRKLQALLDRYAQQGPTTICLQPGTYELAAPLVIGREHAGLTIRGCSSGVVLEAAGNSEKFALGLILLERALGFTLGNVELALPLVRFKSSSRALGGLPQERQSLLAAYTKELYLSIGVYALEGSELRFEECTFRFPTRGANVFSAGIFGTRRVRGLEVVDCEFVAEEQTTTPFSQLAQLVEAEPPYQVRFGYLQVPTRAADATFRMREADVAEGTHVIGDRVEQPKLSKREAAAVAKAQAAAAAQIGVPSLADATFAGNLFDGLTVPVLLMGQAGTVRIDDNTVRSCYGGFWLVTTGTTNVVSMLDRIGAGNQDLWSFLVESQLTGLGDPVLLFASVMGRLLPVTPDASQPAGEVGAIFAPTTKLLQSAERLFTRLYAVRGEEQAAPAPAPAPAPAADDAPAPFVEAPTTSGPAPAVTSPQLAKGEGVSVGKLQELPANLAGLFKERGAVDVGELIPEADPGTALAPRIDVTRNQVDAVIADSYSGAGLLVIALDTTRASSLVCSGNRIRSRIVAGATASLWSLAECAVTGNIVSNEIEGLARGSRSLVLRPQKMGDFAAVAVTGNVLIGRALLPPRDKPAPFDDWVDLNTVIGYVAP